MFVAVQLMVVMPALNVNGLGVMGLPVPLPALAPLMTQDQVMGAVPEIRNGWPGSRLAEQRLFAVLTEIFAGQLIKGGSLDETSTVNEQAAEFPQASVTW